MGCFSKTLLITLAVVVMTATCAWANDNMMSERVVDRDRLVAIAQDKGSVKVIVRLDVSNIKKLTAASTAYKAVTPGQSFPQEGVQADAALAVNIASISNRLTAINEHSHTFK